ncbi:ELF3-like protein 2, partial [Cucurbita argyrosperma subsp. sororia]
MKRGKDDEKTVEPIFPRLHVNDTEKGWPRAPPRNKMALYEQFTIPSIRSSPGVLPLKTNISRKPVTTPSSSQGTGTDRDLRLPLNLSSPTSTNEVGNSQALPSGEVNVNPPSVQPDQIQQTTEVEDEDDFTVPVYDQSRMGKSRVKNSNLKEKLSSPGSKHSGSTVLQADYENGQSRLTSSNVVEPTRIGELDNVPRSRVDSHSLGKNDSLNIPVDNIENHVERTYNSMQVGNADKSDIVSENSMVDSISGSDICPDDVVGIIGQKHFWKARRAIINQQRVFEVQVFELHRLVKVQRLIAGSPRLILEDGIFLDNSSPTPLPAKKLTSHYTVKSHVQPKLSDGPKKSKYNVECSAENAVGKTSLPPAPIECQPSTCGPYSVNPQPGPGFTGHHWLVPVMSPSEGLIYKPYPGPGFVFGGCGPYGPMMNPSFGFPASVHQGIGALPNTPMVGGTYFPPFGMPVMNRGMSGSAVDQVNRSSGDLNQLSGGVAASNMQHQTSYDVSTQRDRDENQETVSLTPKSHAPKRNEVQVSTASSPVTSPASEVQANQTAESHDVLPLAPVVPLLVEKGPQPSDSDQTRVIRVVPHNRRSANESAARIFQSIQNERQQYDSI